MQTQLCFLTAADIIRGYRQGAFTPFDVVDSYLRRIAERDPFFGAFVNVMHDQALRSCAESANRLVSGRARALEGVPIAIKDMLEIEETICGAGSLSRSKTTSSVTATVVRKLVSQGAIIVGKTHTVEFAYGGWGTNQHLGTPRNAWGNRVHLTPGGSSSGSGVAVAARMVPWAIGTDTGGSIRVPAAFNGLVGLKPTYGRVSTYGVIPLSPSLDSIGIIACTVEDATVLFAAIQGFDELDSATYRVPSFSLEGYANKNISGCRVGFIGPSDRRGIAPDILEAYDKSLVLLQAQGVELKELVFPQLLVDYGQDSTVMAAEAYAQHGGVAEDSTIKMDESVRARIIAGSTISTASYLNGRKRLAMQAVQVLECLRDIDVFLVPTTRTLPVPVANVDESTTASVLTRFVNQLGLGSLAVPSGFSTDASTGIRLPTSVQVVCKPFEETMALRIGRAIEEASALDLCPPLIQ